MNAALRLTRSLNLSCKRYLSSNKLPPEIVMPINSEMIVCWHPKQDFPYEYSLPLPEEKHIPSNTVLCIGNKEIAEVFHHKRREVVIQELSKITHTTKHRWYPKSRDKKEKKTLPDRPYL